MTFLAKIKTFLFIFATISFNLVHCDIPILCPKAGGHVEYVGRTWKFYISKEKKRINLFKEKEVCHHTIPNSIESRPSFNLSLP